MGAVVLGVLHGKRNLGCGPEREAGAVERAGNSPGPGSGNFLNVVTRRQLSGPRHLEARGRFCQERGFEGARGVPFHHPELGVGGGGGGGVS